MTTTVPWPVALRGVLETVVTTRQPDGTYNVAALGISAGNPATARTWGTTRTRRNFQRTGEGFVQFVYDPVAFVRAALTVEEHKDSVLPAANAWARVRVESLGTGTSQGTDWERWALEPIETTLRADPQPAVPIINRAHGAVIEASVAASRLEIPAYDRDTLLAVIDRCGTVVDRTGGEREQAALEVIAAETAWSPSETQNDEL